MRILRKASRRVVRRATLAIEKAYEWIDARKSRNKVYRTIMLLTAIALLCWYVVLCVKCIWQSWQLDRLTWQMIECLPLGFLAEFFAHLANLFGPDDRRDPPDDPTYPWPRSPEDNYAEQVLIFECVLDGRPSWRKTTMMGNG